MGSPRVARRVSLRHPKESFLIDDGLALWFPGPGSFTGEDVVELHLHGSPAVEHALNGVLVDLGLEPAGPGAFTMRAFSNGKMDLTQAEGLSDLLEAETELQHRQAIDHYRGKLRDVADGWRRDLVIAMGKLDASVDFPDEDDVPVAIASGALTAVERVRTSLAEVLNASSVARKVTEGFRVALVGPPNAGKSSLFNKLIETERALVSEEAGTTRDIVSETVSVGGHRVTFLDMAGIRESSDSAVEMAGISRALQEAENADLRLLCYPASDGGLPDWLQEIRRAGDLVVRTKSDLGSFKDGMLVSMVDGGSVKLLRDRLVAYFGELAFPGLAPSDRQSALVQSAERILRDFEVQANLGAELGFEVLRSAASKLERLTGRIAPDDVLDDIFSSFCIGK